MCKGETFTSASSTTSIDHVQRREKFANLADYGAAKPEHVWSNVATARQAGSHCRWIMNMHNFNAYSGTYGLQALLQIPKRKHFWGEIFQIKMKYLILSTCFSLNLPCPFMESPKKRGKRSASDVFRALDGISCVILFSDY